MLEVGEKTLRAEVEALKVELQQNRQPQSSSTGTSVGDQTSVIGTPDQKSSSAGTSHEGRSQIVSLSPGKTAQPFAGAILITFQGSRFEGNPPRYGADVTLGRVGKPSKDLQGITAGQVLIYEGFEVRLTDTDPFSVKFLVTRL